MIPRQMASGYPPHMMMRMRAPFSHHPHHHRRMMEPRNQREYEMMQHQQRMQMIRAQQYPPSMQTMHRPGLAEVTFIVF